MARKRDRPQSPLGAWALRVRLGLGLTQENFAARIRRARGTVADWERGANPPDSASVSLIMRTFPEAETPPFGANSNPPEPLPDHQRALPRASRQGGYAARTEEARVVARAMDGMTASQRHEALRRILNFIAESTPPPSRPAKA